MENKIQKLLKQHAERSRQISILGTVMFTVALMIAATIETSMAATTGDVNIAQNVTAGSLAIAACDQLNFSSGGVGDTTTANIDITHYMVINDTRGTSAGWDVTGYFITNFLKTGDTSVQMAMTPMNWYPTTHMIVHNGTGDNADTTKGDDGLFGGIAVGNSKTLVNAAATGGEGSFNIYNVQFNYTIPIDAEATDYTTDLRFTIV